MTSTTSSHRSVLDDNDHDNVVVQPNQGSRTDLHEDVVDVTSSAFDVRSSASRRRRHVVGVTLLSALDVVEINK